MGILFFGCLSDDISIVKLTTEKAHYGYHP